MKLDLQRLDMLGLDWEIGRDPDTEEPTSIYFYIRNQQPNKELDAFIKTLELTSIEKETLVLKIEKEIIRLIVNRGFEV